MVTTLTALETGGYSNAARLTLFHRMMNLSENTICYNRDSWKGWGINKKPISRWVYAFSANSMADVARWKVDTGGGKTSSFEPAVKLAIHQILKYNAAVFFANASPSQVEALVQVVFARKGQMSLYAFTDAMECLVNREAPCDIDTYGFDAKAILQACDRYQAKARAEYYEWAKSADVKEFHDIPAGAPVPAAITELREKMESRFGVVYDDKNANIEAMRAAAQRHRAEQAKIDFG